MTDEMFYDVTRLFPMLQGSKSPRPVDMFTGGEEFILTVAGNGHVLKDCGEAMVRRQESSDDMVDLVYRSDENATIRFKLHY